MTSGQLIIFLVLFCRGFPKKTGRTARIASDEEIQGSKDAVIQDLERKLRFKEDLLNNGQPVQKHKIPSFIGEWEWVGVGITRSF